MTRRAHAAMLAGAALVVFGAGRAPRDAEGTRGSPTASDRLGMRLAPDTGSSGSSAIDQTLPEQTRDTLTPIDTVPTTAEIDAQFVDHQTALANLIAITADGNDVGIRVRALHAVAGYCQAPCADADPAHQALVQFIQTTAEQPSTGAQAAANIVMLRSAVEAIGPLRVQGDVDLLEQLLAHPSRDIRAATAHALRDLCNTAAIGPLQIQQSQEPTDQVRQAISDALRALPCT